MNVLLVLHADEDQHTILPEVAKRLCGRGLRARVVHDVDPTLKHQLWAFGSPTVVISLRPIKRFLPHWAHIVQQKQMGKIAECRAFDEAGIPIPKWTLVEEGKKPDLSEFGDFVVVKPAAGCRGAFVRVMKKNRVEWRPVALEHIRGQSSALIAQEYVYTGPWPVSYRVGMVFGEPCYGWRGEASHDRPPFDESVQGSSFFEGRSIVATSRGCTMSADIPQDVLDFARFAATAFPHNPFLAMDIIQDFHSGKLYALEVNTSGWSFCLTSDTRHRIKREFGYDLMEMFDGAEPIAEGIHAYITKNFSVNDAEWGMEQQTWPVQEEVACLS